MTANLYCQNYKPKNYEKPQILILGSKIYSEWSSTE